MRSQSSICRDICSAFSAIRSASKYAVRLSAALAFSIRSSTFFCLVLDGMIGTFLQSVRGRCIRSESAVQSPLQ
ncbi:MAG: hypothetical protein EA377_04470 [Phycisphaerales bacterium]|nr:MAG: hypothetical protein EA377_04470 [Phycisphaerales bacterium]